MICNTCQRPMRRRRANPADHPGTVAAKNQTTCVTCARRQLNQPEPEISDEFHVEYARTALDYWLADRRKRLGVTA